MMMIKWHLCICLFFILLTYKSNTVYSIQCCVGNSTCSSKPVDCPSNVCFKLVFNKVSEYRGCMDDLIDLVKLPDLDSRNSNDDSGSNSGSSNDQCQKLDVPGTGMSLCKCTSNLCNSSSKYSYFSFPVLFFIFFVVYQFPFVFLS